MRSEGESEGEDGMGRGEGEGCEGSVNSQNDILYTDAYAYQVCSPHDPAVPHIPLL